MKSVPRGRLTCRQSAATQRGCVGDCPGRARREAAEAQTAAEHPDAAAELASSAPEVAADPIAAADALTSAGETFESLDSVGADTWS